MNEKEYSTTTRLNKSHNTIWSSDKYRRKTQNPAFTSHANLAWDHLWYTSFFSSLRWKTLRSRLLYCRELAARRLSRSRRQRGGSKQCTKLLVSSPALDRVPSCPGLLRILFLCRWKSSNLAQNLARQCELDQDGEDRYHRKTFECGKWRDR